MATATEKTSHLKILKNNFTHNRSSKGFTLLELMIVVGILGGIMAFGIPRLKLNNNNIKKVTRQFTVLTREVRTQARLKNMTFRIAFKLDPKETTYWVEAANGPVLVQSEEQIKAIEEMREEDRPASAFQKVDKPIKDTKTLPGGLYVASYESVNLEAPLTSGMAYFYFTPEGLVERSAIQITNGDKLTWTLIFNPLTGHADIVERAISLKELKEL